MAKWHGFEIFALIALPLASGRMSWEIASSFNESGATFRVPDETRNGGKSCFQWVHETFFLKQELYSPMGSKAYYHDARQPDSKSEVSDLCIKTGFKQYDHIEYDDYGLAGDQVPPTKSYVESEGKKFDFWFGLRTTNGSLGYFVGRHLIDWAFGPSDSLVNVPEFKFYARSASAVWSDCEDVVLIVAYGSMYPFHTYVDYYQQEYSWVVLSHNPSIQPATKTKILDVLKEMKFDLNNVVLADYSRCKN